MSFRVPLLLVSFLRHCRVFVICRFSPFAVRLAYYTEIGTVVKGCEQKIGEIVFGETHLTTLDSCGKVPDSRKEA